MSHRSRSSTMSLEADISAPLSDAKAVGTGDRGHRPDGQRQSTPFRGWRLYSPYTHSLRFHGSSRPRRPAATTSARRRGLVTLRRRQLLRRRDHRVHAVDRVASTVTAPRRAVTGPDG